ncbi:MAG: hypothetical protein QOH10_2381 [Actinomycetota bacterium]|nr:hypothetical protein [Actinomycetota bacterium]
MADVGLAVREWDTTAVDPALVLVRLLRTNALLVARLHDAFAEAGLPPFDLLRLLWSWSEHDVALEVRAIATNLGLSRSAASRLVDRAERAGLVRRRRGILDEREISVRVTTRGRAAIHRLDVALRASARPIRFDDGELGRLDELLERVVRRYERS